MNGLGKPFRNKIQSKKSKNSKNQNAIAACEQKTTSEKANFCSNSGLSLYFKIKVKKFSLFHLLFRSTSYFGVTKIMKMCEQISKNPKNPLKRHPNTQTKRASKNL